MNFKENDKLNREHFADFLIEVITNNQKYKRESESDSFVLAIDSSWGTGKTCFLNMLADKMTKIEDNNYTIINYNAWKSDAWKNPFETLIYTILENKIFNATDDINNLKQLGRDLKDVAKSIGKSFLKKQLSKVVSEDIIDEFDKKFLESGDYKTFLNNTSVNYDFFKEYKQYNDSIDSMKTNLKKVCKKTQLIIFVDELDRCKPTFAIELLEMIKHLFDVENMIFVFALDITQLSYSVQSVYGKGIDSIGYLCRFFDYISKLPKVDTNIYIDSIMEKNPLINNKLKQEMNKDGTYTDKTFASVFKELAILYNLSLRDINTIYSSFLLFEKMELSNVENLEAYKYYLFLMIMKYKDSDCFYKMFIKKEDIREEIFIKKIRQFLNLYEYREWIAFIQRDNIIKDIETGDGFKIYNVDLENKKIYYTKDSGFRSCTENLYEYKVYNEILFYNDIMKWEEIKDLSVKNFIHRKLEMFDFSWKENLQDKQD